MGDLLSTVPTRFRSRAFNSMDDINPEHVIGLRGLAKAPVFVNSNNTAAAAQRDGRSWDGAYLTMVEAALVAGADGLVCVAPLHVETVTAAGGLTLALAGCTFQGFGNGNRRPQINFTTAVTASMLITGAGTRMDNFRFTGGIDALTNPVHIQAADVELTNIVTEDVTGQATDFIVTTAAAVRLLIDAWDHRGAAAAGADTALSMVGGDDSKILNYNLYGNFAVAAIENVTTAAARLLIGAGRIWTENAADIAITLVATTTGWLGPNIQIMLQDNAANITECVVGAAMQFILPINVCNLAGEASMVINTTASTDA